MGCDYYIYVYLEIQHKNGISYYEFPIIRGYFCELNCGIYDSDDDEADYYHNSIEFLELQEKMEKICLTSRKPVIIYENNSFISPKFENKYLSIVQNKINKKTVQKYIQYEETGTFSSIDDIITITKKEIRHDPYKM